MTAVIRRCQDCDFDAVLSIVNEAATAYRGVIPEDRYHEPYMSADELRREMAEGVVFWGYEEDGELIGVMGLQDLDDVTLIRHAYVKTARQGEGIGGRLMARLLALAEPPVLVGTWADAEWAVRFYEKHGFRLLATEEKNTLLQRYWSIPERQVETSVVLADRSWFAPARGL
ncbi:MAG: N-acetyltransferase [Actinobacteria bacterium]|nr:MAG: N-acetyltransferase [Actinomycetota bacterium]